MKTIAQLQRTCDTVLTLARQLDACNWQDQALEARYHAAREQAVAALAPLLDPMAQAGLIALTVWKRNTFVQLDASSVSANGGLQMNAAANNIVGSSTHKAAITLKW